MALEFGGEFYNPDRLPDLKGMNGYKDVSRELPTDDHVFDSPTVVSESAAGTGDPVFPDSGLAPTFDPEVSVPVGM